MMIKQPNKMWNTDWLVALFKGYQTEFPDQNWDENGPNAQLFRQYADQIQMAAKEERDRRNQEAFEKQMEKEQSGQGELNLDQ